MQMDGTVPPTVYLRKPDIERGLCAVLPIRK